MAKIEKGNKITVEYTGTFDDGTVFDSSEKHGKALEFVAGIGMVVPGFDNAVVGMEKGEEKEIKLTPAEAYGEPNPQMVKKFPKDQLPQDKEIKAGMLLAVGLPNGQQIPAKITEVGDKEVTVDLNHPLAGKTLNFKIKIVEVKEGNHEEQCESCADDGCGCGH